jgi:hypothetical protein
MLRASAKSHTTVTPANTGVQKCVNTLDPGICQDDTTAGKPTF